MAVEFTATFEESNSNFDTTFDALTNEFDSNYGETIELVTRDHTLLTNRDALNQHPIYSITNLQSELDDIETEPLTNVEIQNILNS